ncbi:MAG TPA: Cro/CI family transcriptional regulator [Geminicoccus sp.]|uniref:transcriptional regulator n=1 Tax=Geminicoccus sp. TaxID=2024832 RepID=UPI002B5F05C6|nr:Cro/CI family transcriptional regulator [Geminicoccus sp.]HWL68155.1 Cro/CI family transcriptional regulator [Geminicoccus sp.]
MITSSHRQALLRAIRICGSTRRLAAELGITPQAVSQWRRTPATRVLQVERLTGGKVRRSELRPDLYPESSEEPAFSRSSFRCSTDSSPLPTQSPGGAPR